MRLSSYDGDRSNIFNFCMNDWNEFDASNKFCIIDDQFKLYNKGHNEHGGHKKGKNGELEMQSQ